MAIYIFDGQPKCSDAPVCCVTLLKLEQGVSVDVPVIHRDMPADSCTAAAVSRAHLSCILLHDDYFSRGGGVGWDLLRQPSITCAHD